MEEQTRPEKSSNLGLVCFRQALKQLSVSAPVMTQAQAAARPQPASDPLVTPAGPPSPEQQTGSSKSRQKKFHRHFKQVAAEERVVNCKYFQLFL